MTKLEILNKNIAKKAQSKLGITYNQRIKKVALESMQEYSDQQLILYSVGKRSELLLDFLQKLKETDALVHTETWQLKTYVANYLKDK